MMMLKQSIAALLLLAPAALEAAAPPVPTDLFVTSTDTATYGKRVSQQIPAIARVGTRWF